MEKFIKVADKQVKKHLKKIDREAKRSAKKSALSFLTSCAFNTRKTIINKTLPQKFTFKNNATKKYITKYIRYKPAKGSKEFSEVGATGNIDGATFKERQAAFMAKQEFGGKATQLKTKGRGKRKDLLQKNPRNVKKAYQKIPGSTIKIKSSGNQKQKFARAIRVARKKNINYISNIWGVYKVTKRTLKKIYSIKKPGTHTIPKREWLKSATDLTMKKREDIWRESVKHHLEKTLKKK